MSVLWDDNDLQKVLLFFWAALFPACSTPQPPVIQPEYSASYTAPAEPIHPHINTPWMKTGESYPLAEEGAWLRVEISADGEKKRLMLHHGNFWPVLLDTSIRHFGYAWSPLAPEYFVVFHNYASRENSVQLYRLHPSGEQAYYELTPQHSANRCAWHVKTWTRSAIVLEGEQESTTPGANARLYCHIPLQH